MYVLKLHTEKGLTEGKPVGKTEKRKEEINKMASTILNANERASYSKLVPVFDGVKEELSIFIANLELLNDTIE